MAAKRVLVVDGDSDSRTVYRIVLEHHGYEVLDTADGEEAIRLAQSEGVAAVVTELTLRQVDGHTVVQRLRAQPATQSLCVIVLTARVVSAERERAVQAGCTQFLTKPIEPKHLVATIRELIGDP